VNDKTSTPDEPDRRGSVATGEHAAVPQQAAGSETPAATGDESAGAVRPGAGAASDADAPTTEMRVPAPTNGSAARPAPGAPATNDEGRATDRAGAPEQAAHQPPSPGPSGRTPAPAPGPVPGPGPAAAAPPPWSRIPVEENRAHQEPEAAERPAGGLLDNAHEEGPTAYLEASERPGGPSESDSRQDERGTWSAARAMRNRPPRQAALQLKRLDPWSVLKLGLVLALVLFLIWMVAVGVLYGALDGMGVWDRLNGTYADLVSGEAPTGSPLISAGRVFLFAGVIGAINSLLLAVAVTVGAFVYNVSADLVGGIEVTLSERD
jgi:hypothetical protein